MHPQIRRQRHRRAKTKQYAQSIKRHVDHRDAELVDKRRGQEVQQRQQPPDADEERVVDDRVGAVGRAVDVVGHEGCDEDGADELGFVRMRIWVWEGGVRRRTWKARRPMERTLETILADVDVWIQVSIEIRRKDTVSISDLSLQVKSVAE